MNKKITETWKPIIGYEELYEASSKGNIRSLVFPIPGGIRIRETPRLLKPKTKFNGYLEVGLNRNKTKTMHYVHRIVLEAFSGACPDGMECGHINGDKTNNSIANLCWLLPIANMRMAVDQGFMKKGENNCNAKLTEAMVLKIKTEYVPRKVTCKSLAEKYGVCPSAIQSIVRGRNWKHVEVSNA
jgi:hypothetical protein